MSCLAVELKKWNYIYIIFFVGLIFCKSSAYGQNNKFVPEYSTILPLEMGQEMMKQCSRAVPNNIEKFYNLSEQDIQLLETHFQKLLNVKSANCCCIGCKIKTLECYGFQYLGVIINNKKYIYINAFEYETQDEFQLFYKDWKTQPMIWCDGGDAAWGVLFYLEKTEFSQLSFNGIA